MPTLEPPDEIAAHIRDAITASDRWVIVGVSQRGQQVNECLHAAMILRGYPESELTACGFEYLDPFSRERLAGNLFTFPRWLLSFSDLRYVLDKMDTRLPDGEQDVVILGAKPEEREAVMGFFEAALADCFAPPAEVN